MNGSSATVLREMRPDELILVETVHASAFDGVEEARLPKAVVAAGCKTLSVVAEDDGFLIGHAFFSALEGADRALALGPVAVAPDRQGAGVGSRLIRFGLELARDRGWHSVFVLGDPAYYGRFGFEAALAARAAVPWPGSNFQALELQPGALSRWEGGVLIYPDAFSSLSE